MKILVVFTGGTIGSSLKNGWISNDSETNYLLINNYLNESEDKTTEFVTCSPYTILSENLTEKELNLLQKCVADNLNKDFDGIIITHGTDTLQYTAAALSYAFSDADIPIVLVSSDYPLSDVRANGGKNFETAVKFINCGAANGVFVSYKNSKDDVAAIHKATRVSQYTEATADLYSIDGEPFAFCGQNVMANDEYKASDVSEGLGCIDFCGAPRILVIESRPGDNFAYSLEECQAVILRPYHSGTLNTDSKALKALCVEAKEKAIPVFAVNIRPGTSYESTKFYDELGLEILPMCSFSAIYVKCWAAISLNKNVAEFVKNPIAEEFCV
ncbi:MAG: asparaginase [Clostridia bacterium]|nr:asparaginase [Clostridia bacterium]